MIFAINGRLRRSLVVPFVVVLMLFGYSTIFATPARAPLTGDLWVDAINGSDANNGQTSATAFRTIQQAANFAGPGTTVHILPGIYRESIRPAQSGSATAPILYTAEKGLGTVVVRGSEPSASFTWTPLTSNTIGLRPGVDPTKIYSADLTAWGLMQAPRFVVTLDANGNVAARLPLAREPNWSVATNWKQTEFWWTAAGGSGPAPCDPTTNPDHNCDLPSRSLTQLTDPAHLTSLGDLTGATLVALDTVQGTYTYRRTITAHNVAAGQITVDRICEVDSGTGNPGLGWGAKYYVENHPALLDTPGEWWYNVNDKHLYLYPPSPGNPASMPIEISSQDVGFDLHNRSYTTLDGITVELVDGTAVSLHDDSTSQALHDTVQNAALLYGNIGVDVEQTALATAPGNVVDSFTLQNSQVGYMDTQGLRLMDWWEGNADPNLFTHSGVTNTEIRGNEFHDLGFRSDDDTGVGLTFYFADKLRFENNHVHDVAHNGVQFSDSVIQSNKGYGFAPSDIKTGDILIQNNTFERACEQNTDCGALKIWGSPPQEHVFRNLLITGNVFRDTIGWSSVAQARGLYSGGPSSSLQGMGGIGLYVDTASGVYAYRNISYDNGNADYLFYGVWRDGDMVFLNNVAANSLYGFSLGGPSFDTHGNVNTQIENNIIVNNEGFGMLTSAATPAFGNLTIDDNLYFGNGWRTAGGMWRPGDMVLSMNTPYAWSPLQTLAAIQANTPWERNGVEANPAFQDFNLADHNIFVDSGPDFHLTSASPAIDKGTTSLPATLAALLSEFGVIDWRSGPAYDIGRYEMGLGFYAAPPAQGIRPGGVARYNLFLYVTTSPGPANLSVTSPSSDLIVTLSSSVITPGTSVTLAVTDTHPASYQGPYLAYTIPISVAGNGYTESMNVDLLVTNDFLYLPIVGK